MSTCEKYNFELKKPCSRENCSHHINCPERKNCLFLKLKEEGTSFQLVDVFKILGINRSEFRKNVFKAINESRVSKLDSVIGTGNEFEYVPNSDICICCGAQVDRQKWKVGELAYCSKACQLELPPTIATLTNRLGIDERTLLFALVQCFSGEKICEMLQIEQKIFKKWVMKLCGIKLKFLTDNAPQDYTPLLDKPVKIHSKCLKKSFIFNNDSVFKEVDDFCSI